ncbi:Brix-domain-containing protein [Myriangium duriaei CBS 260.36]|uniref:Brix-domain-containing protein n=1 Tax=Myriangium duriaei CBS 260.36 TaxID=1168546 RepID=A0A9P4J451_9PEZI|nr:Brix-domain-containing protein [Myriangium duriaei CBS 260.36]
MAKRRVKKRPQAHVAARTASSKPGERTPKSMVIRIGAGEVGASVSQLVKDVREVMEPHTASRLKERRANKLRDYTTMAGPLGITHLLLFSRSENGNTNLRLAITPRGPTLHFRVTNYSLCKDIVKSLKRAKSVGTEHTTSPLLVMNNFSSKEGSQNDAVPKHLESLTTSIFQSLFAPINPQATPLQSIKRILLLDRAATKPGSDDPPYVLNFRHYSIATPVARSSQPRALRKFNTAAGVTNPSRKKLPNLGKLGDVSEYLLDPAAAAAGFTSASETELDTDAEVENTEKSDDEDEEGPQQAQPEYRTTKDRVEKRAIKLTELGPRMTLRLTKVEEGLCGGKVMWHEYIHKTKAEVAEMERTWDKRKKEKEERRRVQKENVERKKKEKLANGEQGELAAEEMAELMGDGDDDFWDDEEDDEDDDEEEGVEEDVEMEDE